MNCFTSIEIEDLKINYIISQYRADVALIVSRVKEHRDEVSTGRWYYDREDSFVLLYVEGVYFYMEGVYNTPDVMEYGIGCNDGVHEYSLVYSDPIDGDIRRAFHMVYKPGELSPRWLLL